jgi:hypothetical protein
MIVLATGFEHPKVGVLPDGLFPDGYEVRGTDLFHLLKGLF